MYTYIYIYINKLQNRKGKTRKIFAILLWPLYPNHCKSDTLFS